MQVQQGFQQKNEQIKEIFLALDAVLQLEKHTHTNCFAVHFYSGAYIICVYIYISPFISFFHY